MVYKDMGLVAQVFNESVLNTLHGHIAVGHCRYSTSGSSVWENAQPTFRATPSASLALGHNGNLINTLELASLLGGQSAALAGRATSDTDVLTALFAATGIGEGDNPAYGHSPNGSILPATALSATAVNGTAPNGTAPNGTAPNGTAPNGTAPNATGLPRTGQPLTAAFLTAPALARLAPRIRASRRRRWRCCRWSGARSRWFSWTSRRYTRRVTRRVSVLSSSAGWPAAGS